MGNTTLQPEQLSSDVPSPSTRQMSSPLKLKDLVTKFDKQFPLLMRISKLKKKGSSTTTLRQGQYFYVHFHKESEIVKIVTKNGATYSVPLRSSLVCSCLYNPQNLEISRAMEGYTFKSVGEILSSIPLPQMVYATQGYLSPSGNESACVDEGQVLKLLGVHVDDKGNRALKCIDVNSYEQKILEPDCNVEFSTNTSYLKLELATLMQHVYLPAHVVFFSPTDIHSQCFPKEIPCVINEQSIGLSVIVSPFTETSLDFMPKLFIEILVSAPIEACIVSLTEDEKHNLMDKTLNLLTMFSPSLLAEVVGDLMTPIDTGVQTALFKYIEQDIYWSKEFIDQEMSVLKKKTTRFNPTNVMDSAPHTDTVESDDDSQLYEEVIPVPLPEKSLKQCSVDLPPLLDLPPPFPSVELNEMQPEEKKSVVSTVFPKVNSEVSSDLQEYTLVNKTNKMSKEECTSADVLKSYSVSEVLDLLDKLNLSDYKKRFEEEVITGGLLLELDDEILEQDLGMKSRLHRLKLQRVIDGRTPLP